MGFYSNVILRHVLEMTKSSRGETWRSTESSEVDEEQDTEEELSRRTPLSIFTFAYCLPLLKSVLCDRPALFTESKEDISLTALKLVQLHLDPENIDVRTKRFCNLYDQGVYELIDHIKEGIKLCNARLLVSA